MAKTSLWNLWRHACLWFSEAKFPTWVWCVFCAVDGYSVVLPEKLSTGKWHVYRSARSPLQLVDHWAEHPEIRTLHDNFVYATCLQSTLYLWFWYICKKCLNRFVDLLCSYKTHYSNNQKLFFLSVSIFFCKIVNDTIIAGIGLVFWSYSSKAYADEKCLGSRIRDDGTVGE
jgi:hypothetical protein